MTRTIFEMPNEIKARLIESLKRDVARLPQDAEFHLATGRCLAIRFQ
jgi:hypothetical protein